MCYKIIFFTAFIFFSFSLSAQETYILKGRVDLDVADGLQANIINLHTKKATISHPDGSFSIEVALGNLVLFSSIGYTSKQIEITREILAEEKLVIRLDQSMDMLDEVHLSNSNLTGDLTKDAEIVPYFDQAEIGFPIRYKQMTGAERRLYAATTGAGGALGIDPLINAISGRTKRLKRYVKNEKDAEARRWLRELLPNDFFTDKLGLAEEQIELFVDFCFDKPKLRELIKEKQPLKIISFVEHSYHEFISN